MQSTLPLLVVGLSGCGADTRLLVEIVGSAQVPTDIDSVTVSIRKGSVTLFPQDAHDESSFKLPGPLPQTIAVAVGTEPPASDRGTLGAIVLDEAVGESGKLTVMVIGKRNGVIKMAIERDVNMTPGETVTLQLPLSGSSTGGDTGSGSGGGTTICAAVLTRCGPSSDCGQFAQSGINTNQSATWCNELNSQCTPCK